MFLRYSHSNKHLNHTIFHQPSLHFPLKRGVLSLKVWQKPPIKHPFPIGNPHVPIGNTIFQIVHFPACYVSFTGEVETFCGQESSQAPNPVSLAPLLLVFFSCANDTHCIQIMPLASGSCQAPPTYREYSSDRKKQFFQCLVLKVLR